MKTIAVLGAGPSGLSVAWGLAGKVDFKVTLLERGDSVGGLGRTITHKGLSFDIGPHRLSPQLPHIVDAVRELLGEDLKERKNVHGVFLHDSFYHYPPGLKDFLRVSSLKATISFGASWALARLADAVTLPSSKRKRSFDVLLKNYFGRKFYEEVIVPMIFKVWGTGDLHHDFARIRFELPTFSRMIKRIFVKGATISDDVFYYPAKGFGQIWERVSEHVREKGHTIALGARIESIEASSLAGPFTIRYEKDGKPHSLTADALVSTISNTDLLGYMKVTGLVDPVLHAQKAFRSRTLRLGVMAVRNFSIPARVIIFPEAKYVFNRVSEMNQFADLGYPQGESILLIDVICDKGDSFDRLTEKEFNDLLLKNFLSLGWVKESDVRTVFSLRFPGAYPVLTEERYEAQEAVEKFFSGTNVYLCGREASSDYNNAHNAVGKGFLTAKRITGEIGFDEYKRASATIGRLPIQD